MPRHVYRVSIELIHSDAGETLPVGPVVPSMERFVEWETDRLAETDRIANLRARIMGVPGLVKYPQDVTSQQSWGKTLRRNEPLVIELDIDRDATDEKGADRACLMNVVDYLTIPEPMGAPYWMKGTFSYWPAVTAWHWDGEDETFDTIKHDVEKLVPGAEVLRERLNEGAEILVNAPRPDEGTNGWLCFKGGYIVLDNGHLASWSGELFEEHYTPQRPDSPAMVAEEDIHPGDEVELHTPEEWSRMLHITVIDPDGWMSPKLGPKAWGEFISEQEFMERAAESTCDWSTHMATKQPET